tara:strand:- start:10360 stop:11202 length:843 start_codon:yes stop_codon:yes gene_type:complete
MAKIVGRWKTFLQEQKEQNYFKELIGFVQEARKAGDVYPASPDVFKAFELTPFEDVKVVILGIEPYPTVTANGLAYDSGKGLSPILRLMLDEMIRSFLAIPGANDWNNGDLTGWTKQGVLLLNRVLTVDAGKPESHANQGWELFTSNVIDTLMNEKDEVIWMVWGSDAQRAMDGKTSLSKKHKQLRGFHPSAQLENPKNLFTGCNHFWKTNKLLIKAGMSPISWDQNLDVPEFKTWRQYEQWRKEGPNNTLPYFEMFRQDWTYLGPGHSKQRRDLTTHPI